MHIHFTFLHRRFAAMVPKLSILLYLLSVSTFVASQSIVKNLPGYSGDLPFKLETGYVSVGDSEDVQLFYYFFESERSPKDDPLVLWLTGGPGCSSISGLAFEVGPIYFPDAHWEGANVGGEAPVLGLNPYSWTKFLNMIFLDAPVGTGFSYANAPEAYEVTDTLQVAHTCEFLRKWLLAHPYFLKNPLYISGDSYSGTIIPMIVQEITYSIKAGREPLMNLKGYTIGNPVTDRLAESLSRHEFAYQKALISKRLYQSLTDNCKSDENNLAGKNDSLCQASLEEFTKCTELLSFHNILEHSCYNFTDPDMRSNWDSNSHPRKAFISLIPQVPPPRSPTCRAVDTVRRRHNYMYAYYWANDQSVQKALHIREGSIEEWLRCNQSLAYTFNVFSATIYHKNLLDKDYRIFIYSGDHDMVVSHLSTQAWIESLNLTVIDDWRPWFVDDEIAGYSTEYAGEKYGWTYATVKGSGHTAPEYNPKECFAMASRWFSHKPL